MTALYEIAQQYNEILKLVDDEKLTIEQVADTLEANQFELEEKSKNVAAFIGNLESQANEIDEAIKKMQVRKRSLKNKADSIREYLLTNMINTETSLISCPYFDIKVRKCPPSVVIDDEKSIPGKYKIEIVTSRIDKTAIKKDGGCLGARIVNNKRLEIK